MSKQAKTMLILSCIFVTICLAIFVYDAYISISTYTILFGSHPETFGEALGTVFGGIILYVLTILFGIGVLAAGAVTLPFDIRLLKLNGKKWYSITILVAAITMMVLAIAFVAMLPVVAKIQDAAKEAANSSSNPDSSVALLFLL